jgi:hypothetical protein
MQTWLFSFGFPKSKKLEKTTSFSFLRTFLEEFFKLKKDVFLLIFEMDPFSKEAPPKNFVLNYPHIRKGECA